jgi:thiamine biosynthesis lipoprotein
MSDIAVLRHSEDVMGTVATVEIRSPGAAGPRLLADAFAWLHEVDRRFSTYRSDSEVSRFDRGEVTLAECSPDLRFVLDECAELWRRTDGYFDCYATGRLDPSGYVKGWAVQTASERLTAAGAANHYVDTGGDIQARGRPAPDREWVIGVRHPWIRDKVCWVLSGTDIAVATSGTYERGAHVVNPRSGLPAWHIRAVTVVGRDLALADAYATTALAMGNAALGWLSQLDGHSAGLVLADGTSYVSPGLPLADPTETDGHTVPPTVQSLTSGMSSRCSTTWASWRCCVGGSLVAAIRTRALGSDRQGKLGERHSHSLHAGHVDGDLVVSTAEVLDEGALCVKI